MWWLFFPALALAGTSPWPALLDEGDSARVHFGASIGGDTPYARSAQAPFAPASTAKLLTAGALLAAVGPDFRYVARLRWTETAPGTASRLTLVGDGDPSWGLSELGESARDRFDAMAAALVNAGVTTVVGEPAAVPSDPRWTAVTIPEGWKDSDTLSCEGALASAFNIGLNCATLSVSSPTHAQWSDGAVYPVRLSIREASSTAISARFAGDAFEITGTWKNGSAPYSFALPIFDTRAWAASLLRAALVAKGVHVVPGIATRGPARELAFPSRPLAEMLKPFLKNSINVMGDAFLKTLAARHGANICGSPPAAPFDDSLLAPALVELGAFVRRFADERDFDLHDGSGLSRTSRLTPALLYRFLEEAPREPWFPTLYDSLPVAGVDGTLRNRMKGTRAEGRLHAKTGTLDGVYNLAGYVPRAGGGYVPFVILTDTTSSLAGPAKAAADRVGARLAELYTDLASRWISDPFPFVPEHAGRDDL